MSAKGTTPHPVAPDSILKNFMHPALEEMKIDKRIGWHSFRHGLGTLLRQQGVDLKTAQELLRHANARVTMELYQQSVSKEKHSANAVAVRGLLGDAVQSNSRALQQGSRQERSRP